MLIEFVEVRNFRKLKSCRIDFSQRKTVFVGANNCGKTSAMDALIMFLKDPSKLQARDFTLSNWEELNKIGAVWVDSANVPDLAISQWEDHIPQLDVWLNVPVREVHFVSQLIPTLDWQQGLIGVRFRFQPKNIEKLYSEYTNSYKTAREIADKSDTDLKLWPRNLLHFLERKIQTYFDVVPFLLDSEKITSPDSNCIATPQKLLPGALPLEKDPFRGLVKIDVITAQRGFSDSNSDPDERHLNTVSLAGQFKSYYAKHLDPTEQPELKDLAALKAIEEAQRSFDDKLTVSFADSLKELEKLNYPGFGGNPRIKLSTKLRTIDGLNHGSSIQFSLITKSDDVDSNPTLPEKYNGLGYQNLISMVFKLIGFRDEWMQVGKKLLATTNDDKASEFEPLHLVLVEEPEAFLHAQVQQVFIRKAYEILRSHELLKDESIFRTQLIVSTHSSHIAHEIDFKSLRYFKRIPASQQSIATSTVVNLSKTFGSEDDTMRFATRYLKTTHCDLFFADAVIIVEGAVERMLTPAFIESSCPELSSCYIALLEIGGRHSYTLQPMLQDLGIATLIITDLDSVDENNKKVLPEKNKNYRSGNSTLNKWLPAKKNLDDLMKLESSEKISKVYPVRVAYQCPINVKLEDDLEDVEIVPYTFEIALAFQNRSLFKGLGEEVTGLLKKFKEAASEKTANTANVKFYEALETGKKAELALDLLFLQDPKVIQPPDYLKEGLQWLKTLLINREEATDHGNVNRI